MNDCPMEGRIPKYLIVAGAYGLFYVGIYTIERHFPCCCILPIGICCIVRHVVMGTTFISLLISGRHSNNHIVTCGLET